MDNRLQATFMPRQAPGATGEYVRPKGPPNFLMIIAVVAILLVGGAWGGLYFYKSIVIKSNEAKKVQIQQEIDKFDPELTKELTILRSRLDAGKQLIASHASPSKFFDLLQANTVQTVQFNSLSYGVVEDGKISFNLKGQASSYNAVAYQSDVFSRVPQIKAPLFSGLVLTEKGTITFNVDAGLDESAVKYSNQFQGETILPLTTSPTATSSVATTTPARPGSATSTSSSATTTTPRVQTDS